MLKVGFIGWRGMVGSVLMARMVENKDFDNIHPIFFSTSQVGQIAEGFVGKYGKLQDANCISSLSKMDIIVSCQGGDTLKIFIRNLGLTNGMAFGLMQHLHFEYQTPVH